MSYFGIPDAIVTESVYHYSKVVPLEVSESLHLAVSVLLGLCQFALVLSLQLRAFLLGRSCYCGQPFH